MAVSNPIKIDKIFTPAGKLVRNDATSSSKQESNCGMVIIIINFDMFWIRNLRTQFLDYSNSPENIVEAVNYLIVDIIERRIINIFICFFH